MPNPLLRKMGYRKNDDDADYARKTPKQYRK